MKREKGSVEKGRKVEKDNGRVVKGRVVKGRKKKEGRKRKEEKGR